MVKIYLFVFISTVFTTLGNAQIKGNGKVLKKEKEVSGFSAINVSRGIDVILNQANEEKVVVEADENLHEYIKIYTRANTLFISTTKSIKKSTKKVVHVWFNDLEKITASSGSDITANTKINVENIDINLSSGSDLVLEFNTEKFTGNFNSGSDAKLKGEAKIIDIKTSSGSDMTGELKAKEIKLKLNSGSDSNFSGSSTFLSISANGGSDADLKDFKASVCDLNLSGGSDVSVKVSDELNIKASGSSDVVYYGNPSKTNFDTTKCSDVVKR